MFIRLFCLFLIKIINQQKQKEMLQITTGIHSQSGKEVAKIVILGRSFIYSDKRGMSMYTHIDAEFAREIIEKIPSKVLHSDKLAYLDNPANDFTLSWLCYGSNKTESCHELRIHFGEKKSDHIWTSISIIA